MQDETTDASLATARTKCSTIRACTKTFKTVSAMVDQLQRAGSQDGRQLQTSAKIQAVAGLHARLSASWVELRPMGLRDERRAAVAGGRRGMNHGTPDAVPLSGVLCMGVCAAAYGLVVTTAVRMLDQAPAAQQHRSRIEGVHILRLADHIIDKDLCGLSRAEAQQANLIDVAGEAATSAAVAGGGAPAATLPQLRTCDGIKAAINHVRSKWRRLHPTQAPVEAYLFVLQAAIGRAAIHPTEDVLDTSAPGEANLYQEEFAATRQTRVSTAFFCDMWLHLSAMLTRRALVLTHLTLIATPAAPPQDLPDDDDNDVQRPYYLANETTAILHEALQRALTPPVSDEFRSPYELHVPEKLALVEWAVKAGQISAADDLLRRVIQITDRYSLWPGDTELHAAYAAGDDSRPSAILAWKARSELAEAEDGDASKDMSDPIAVLRNRDIDTSAMAAACLLRIITQEYQNVGVTELALDALCVYWDDQLEAENSSGLIFTMPSLVQIHDLWVVTFEGMRLQPLVFSLALRTWFFACVRMEQLERLPFSVNMLLRRMQLMRK